MANPSTVRPAGGPNYLVPFITMVILMAMIGLITSINQQFQVPIKGAFLSGAGAYQDTLATLITFSFFLAYLVMGPISARYLDRNGYKRTIVFGLVILAVGLGVFEGSAWLFQATGGSAIQFTDTVSIPVSYFIFLAGSYLCGTGLTYMQSSVNPYIVACSVRGTTGVQRQNISGTANSTMTTLGPLFISYVVFSGAAADQVSIRAIYLPMLILMMFILLLALIVPRLDLPHIAGTTAGDNRHLPKSVWSFSHLTMGVIALFVYVGVEVCVGSNINLYATSQLGMSAANAATLASLYWLCMLIGRLISSFMSKVHARVLLAVSTAAAALLIILFYVLSGQTFTLPLWGAGSVTISLKLLSLIAIGLFHSVMWGAIFALAIDKLGIYTARATGALVMGVFGGAILPVVQAFMADSLGSWDWTWLLVLLGEAYMLFYALVGSRVRTPAE